MKLFLWFQDGRKREIYKLFLVSKDSLKAQVSQMSFRNPHLCYDPNPYMFIVAAVNTSLSPSYSFSTGSQQFQIKIMEC